MEELLMKRTKEKDFNKLKLVNFYIRRARRTLPALIILIFFIIPFFMKSLLPVNLNDFGQSLIATPIFLSNFLFGSENTYWGTISELKPLLHTWSLAIEWQFYIFFPLFFF
jgi:peptidoglycan/LPS O-acetylase OafA/YrhL